MGCNIQCWCDQKEIENSHNTLNKSLHEMKPTAPEVPLDTAVELKIPDRPEATFTKSGSLSYSCIDEKALPMALLQPPQTSGLPPTVLHEGPLFRYKPGVAHEFLPRWCILSSSSFDCYRSLDSARLGGRPLFSVALAKICRVEPVHYHWVQEKHLIEVYLTQEDPMVGVSRETHQPAIDKSVLSQAYVYDLRHAAEPGKLMKRPVRTPFNEAMGKATQRVGWTFREIEWYASEKRLLFAASNKQEQTQWLAAFSQK